VLPAGPFPLPLPLKIRGFDLITIPNPLLLIAIVDDPVFAERVIVAPVPTFHSWMSSEVSVK